MFDSKRSVFKDAIGGCFLLRQKVCSFLQVKTTLSTLMRSIYLSLIQLYFCFKGSYLPLAPNEVYKRVRPRE